MRSGRLLAPPAPAPPALAGGAGTGGAGWRGGGGGLERCLVRGMAESSWPWLVETKRIAWPLHSVAAELCKLLHAESSVGEEQLGAFLRATYEARPPPTAALRDALSIAMHRMLRRHSSLAALSHAVGAVWLPCAGAPHPLPPRWLPLQPLKPSEGRGGDEALPLPVLNDESGKAALLRPEHGFQFLAALDHAKPKGKAATGPAAEAEGGGVSMEHGEEDEEGEDGGLAADLHSMDREVVDSLRVHRLSSAEFRIKIQTAGAEEELPDAFVRLQYVVSLLGCWCEERACSMDGKLLSIRKFGRFKKIVKSFEVPGKKAARASCYAVARPHNDGGLLLLIAGEGEDYCTELQAEVVIRLSLRQAEFPAKHLNLLRYLESARSFGKFLQRDFGVAAADVPSLAALPPPPAPKPELRLPQGSPEEFGSPAAAAAQAAAAAGLAPGGGGRGRGRGGAKLTEPAWKTGARHQAPAGADAMSSSAAISGSGASGGGGGEGAGSEGAPSKVAWAAEAEAAVGAVGAQPAQPLPPMMGRGRGGVSNAPAWATGAKHEAPATSSTEPAKTPVTLNADGTPLWALDADERAKALAEGGGAAAGAGAGAGGGKKRGRGADDEEEAKQAKGAESAAESFLGSLAPPAGSAGRGGGVSNEPAWETGVAHEAPGADAGSQVAELKQENGRLKVAVAGLKSEIAQLKKQGGGKGKKRK